MILSEETLSIIKIIRTELAKQSEQRSTYVSDRRWQRAALLIKASAFFSDRTVTNHTDVLLLRHCLWTTNDNREAVMAIVEEAVRSIGFDSSVSLAKLDLEKEDLEKEIQRDLFYKKDVYKTVTLKGKKKYFKTDATFKGDGYYRTDKSIKDIFIEASLIKTTEEFYPVDESGNEIDEIQGCFNRQGSCELTLQYENSRYYKSFTFTPKILFHKGDKKEEVNNRLINALTKAIQTLKNKLETALGTIKAKLVSYQQALHTQFVPEQIQSIATEGIQQQIEDLKLRIQDCNRLRGLCKQDNA